MGCIQIDCTNWVLHSVCECESYQVLSNEFPFHISKLIWGLIALKLGAWMNLLVERFTRWQIMTLHLISSFRKKAFFFINRFYCDCDLWKRCEALHSYLIHTSTIVNVKKKISSCEMKWSVKSQLAVRFCYQKVLTVFASFNKYSFFGFFLLKTLSRIKLMRTFLI